MTEAEERAAVVAEALTWQGTAYHHHARLKGVGVDCANLPAAVYEAVGLIPNVRPDYAAQWFQHRDEERFLAFVTPYADEIDREAAAPGDFAIWRYGRTFSHGAIIVSPPTIIHSTMNGGGVHLGDMDRDEDLADRPHKFFTLWGAKHGRRR